MQNQPNERCEGLTHFRFRPRDGLRMNRQQIGRHGRCGKNALQARNKDGLVLSVPVFRDPIRQHHRRVRTAHQLGQDVVAPGPRVGLNPRDVPGSGELRGRQGPRVRQHLPVAREILPERHVHMRATPGRQAIEFGIPHHDARLIQFRQRRRPLQDVRRINFRNQNVANQRYRHNSFSLSVAGVPPAVFIVSVSPS